MAHGFPTAASPSEGPPVLSCLHMGGALGKGPCQTLPCSIRDPDQGQKGDQIQ